MTWYGTLNVNNTKYESKPVCIRFIQAKCMRLNHFPEAYFVVYNIATPVLTFTVSVAIIIILTQLNKY